jgi:uncharacterized protein (DUF2267 family)
MSKERLTAEDTLFNVMTESNFTYVSFPAFAENESSVDVYDVCCKAMEAFAKQVIAERMPTEEADRWDAEEFLGTKDIWNHPRITDRCDKESYEVADLMAEFVNDWFRSRMEEKK